MSEPTNQLILDALSANQLALNALLEEQATSGQWAAQGDIYLNGYKIIGGHPEDDTISKDVVIEGYDVQIVAEPDAGEVTIPQARTPSIRWREIIASFSLSDDDNGIFLVAKHTDEEPAITLTLPAITDYDEDLETDVVRSGAYYAQAVNAGSGAVSWAVDTGNSFLNAGVTSTDPIAVVAGKMSVAVYLGEGQWGVF